MKLKRSCTNDASNESPSAACAALRLMMPNVPLERCLRPLFVAAKAAYAVMLTICRLTTVPSDVVATLPSSMIGGSDVAFVPPRLLMIMTA